MQALLRQRNLMIMAIQSARSRDRSVCQSQWRRPLYTIDWSRGMRKRIWSRQAIRALRQAIQLLTTMQKKTQMRSKREKPERLTARSKRLKSKQLLKVKRSRKEFKLTLVSPLNRKIHKQMETGIRIIKKRKSLIGKSR